MLYQRGPPPVWFPQLLRYLKIGEVDLSLCATSGSVLPIGSAAELRRPAQAFYFGLGRVRTFPLKRGGIGLLLDIENDTVLLGVPKRRDFSEIQKVEVLVGNPDPFTLGIIRPAVAIFTRRESAEGLSATAVFSVQKQGALLCTAQRGKWIVERLSP